jgi:hypothetical protein
VKDKAINDAKAFLLEANSTDNISTARDKLKQAMSHITALLPYIPTETSDVAQKVDK